MCHWIQRPLTKNSRIVRNHAIYVPQAFLAKFEATPMEFCRIRLRSYNRSVKTTDYNLNLTKTIYITSYIVNFIPIKLLHILQIPWLMWIFYPASRPEGLFESLPVTEELKIPFGQIAKTNCFANMMIRGFGIKQSFIISTRFYVIGKIAFIYSKA